MLSTVNLRPTQLGLFVESPRPRLYDHVIEVLRLHHYSLRTEEAYVLNTGGRGVQSPSSLGAAQCCRPVVGCATNTGSQRPRIRQNTFHPRTLRPFPRCVVAGDSLRRAQC